MEDTDEFKDVFPRAGDQVVVKKIIRTVQSSGKVLQITVLIYDKKMLLRTRKH